MADGPIFVSNFWTERFAANGLNLLGAIAAAGAMITGVCVASCGGAVPTPADE